LRADGLDWSDFMVHLALLWNDMLVSMDISVAFIG
jgi:hypothetical protein